WKGARGFTKADTIYVLLTHYWQKAQRSACQRKGTLFCETGRGIKMNDRIVGKKITVSIEFEVVTGFVKQHLLGVLKVLPHRQFRCMRIFTNQCLKDLIMVV